MTSRPLRPHLNQIRVWVRQGRTDAWIAHQLDVPADEIATFKREQSLDSDAPSEASEAGQPRIEDEPDLRAADDALIAVELEATMAARAAAANGEGESDAAEGDGEGSTARRRGRRGGRRRRRPAFEGTFDHGEEGYGLWLDPAIIDDAIYAEHWAGHRPVTVSVSSDQIVITRASDDNGAAVALELQAPAATDPAE